MSPQDQIMEAADDDQYGMDLEPERTLFESEFAGEGWDFTRDKLSRELFQEYIDRETQILWCGWCKRAYHPQGNVELTATVH